MPTPIRSSTVAMDMKISSQRQQDAGKTAGAGGRCVARKSVSLLREIFGQAILVISGQRRMMYQSFAPKPEGTIFSKRSEPQGTDRASSRRYHHYNRWLNRSYEGSGPLNTRGPDPLS